MPPQFSTSAPQFQYNDAGLRELSGASSTRPLERAQGFASLQRDLDNYSPEIRESEEFEEYWRDQVLRSSAGLSTVQFSPSSSLVSTVDPETGELISNRYIAIREREKGRVITTYAPLRSTRSVVKGSKLQWRDGGYLLTVQRAGVRPAHDGEQSSLIVKSPPVGEKIERGGNCTSPVPVFSRPSRRRFMRQLASVRVDASPIFITLTYPDHFPEGAKKWKRDLDVFGRRFVRKFGAGFGWRMELKRRLSGENEGKIAPHFHLLTWGCNFRELVSWVSENWYQVVGSCDEKHLLAGTRVERVRSVRGVMWYASKYLAKVESDDLEGCPSVGRLWGFVGRDLIPWADLLEEAISERDAIKLIRWMRKCAHIPSRDYRTLTIFGDGRQWRRCQELLC